MRENIGKIKLILVVVLTTTLLSSCGFSDWGYSSGNGFSPDEQSAGPLDPSQIPGAGHTSETGTISTPTPPPPSSDGGFYDPRTPAQLSISPSSVNYGIQALGSTTNITLTLQNIGQKPATGIAPSILAAPYEFRNGTYPGFRGNCGSVLAAGATCTITLSFRPNSLGRFQRSISLLRFDGGTVSMNLDATAMDIATLRLENIADEGTHTDFGTLAVNQTVDRTINVKFFGNKAATGVTFAGATAPFSILSTTCATEVQSDCSVTVRMRHTSTGSFLQTVRVIYHNSSFVDESSQTVTSEVLPEVTAATLTASSTIGFGNVLVNTSAERTVTIRKGGTLPATSVLAAVFNNPGLSFKGGSYPGTGGNCGTTINSDCTVVVVFAPTSVAAISDSLRLDFHNGLTTTSSSIPFSGMGANPALLTVTPTGITDFGTTVANYPVTRSFLVSNPSTSVTATSVAAYGYSSPFSSPGSCGASIGPGGTCTLYIRFQPNAVGTYNDQFTLSYFDGVVLKNDITRGLTGVVADGALLVPSTANMNFGGVVMGASATQTLTIYYYGTKPATLTTINLNGTHFGFAGGTFPGTGGTCTATITSTCTVVLQFIPASTGNLSDALGITYDNGNGGTPQFTTTLYGTGYAPTAVLNALSSGVFSTVPMGNSSSVTVQVRNSGSTVATSLSLGTVNSPMAFTSTTCGASLPVGQVCDYTFSFSPAAPGIFGQTISLSYYNGSNTTYAAIYLQGTSTITPLLAANGNHTCARNTIGQTKCWGQNNYGQLGLGDTVNRGTDASTGAMGTSLAAVNLGSNRYAKVLALGYWHSCAILDDDTVKCWGANHYGQLGLGSSANIVGDSASEMGNALPTVNLGTSSRPTAITAGYAHTCVLLEDGEVKCWGQNTEGQLGLGDSVDRGRSASDMGSNLPFVALDAEAGQISANSSHTCAVLTDGNVKCWGNNFYGQLGQGDLLNRGDGANEMGANLQPIDFDGARVSQITTGGAFTCAVMQSGGVRCWGRNEEGILGQTYCQNTDGEIGACGGNYSIAQRGIGYSPLHLGDALPEVDLGGANAVSIEAGNSSICAVLSSGAVKCWGANSYGQLGLGDTSSRGLEIAEMGSALPALQLGTNLTSTKITSGAFHHCSILSNSQVKCWGANRFGSLGLQDMLNRGDGPGEMADSLPAVSY